MTLHNIEENILKTILRKSAEDTIFPDVSEVPVDTSTEDEQKSLEELQTKVQELDARATQLEAQSSGLGVTVGDLNTRLGVLSKTLQGTPKKPRKKKEAPADAAGGGGLVFPGFSTSLETDPELQEMYQGGEAALPAGGLSAGPPTLESLQKDLQYVNSRVLFFEKQFAMRSKEISVLQSQIEQAEAFLGKKNGPGAILGDDSGSVPREEAFPSETSGKPPWASEGTPDTSEDVMQQLSGDQAKEEFDQWFEEMKSPSVSKEPEKPKAPEKRVTPQEQKEWDEFLRSLTPPGQAPEPSTPAAEPAPKMEAPFNPVYDESPASVKPQVIPPKPQVTPPKSPEIPRPPAAQPVPEQAPKEPAKVPESKQKKKDPEEDIKESDWTPKKSPKKKKDEDWDEEYAPATTPPTGYSSPKKQKKQKSPREKIQDSHFYDDNPSSDDINEVIKQQNKRDRLKR